MLVPMIVVYIMCMPMGYVIGMYYVANRVNRYENTIDREKERDGLSFVPIMTGMLLPMGAILAIQQIINGDFE